MTIDRNEPAAQDENVSLKPSESSLELIKVDPYGLKAATAINDLLTKPLTVLPCAVGDEVRPLTIGIRFEMERWMKPNISTSTLLSALRRYVRSSVYLIAASQPGAYHHDGNGTPIEPIDQMDRLRAWQMFTNGQQQRQERSRQQRQAGRSRNGGGC
ncbi:ProQ/FINO family protein [Neorhizobium sp. DAR64860/K0K1]|uniref:ProQ/FINO family protein n=1 Tax=Neorhizobium sp. DAR64860/K0K1 TaxID=3421955 RepID=UPI003D29A0A5